MNVLTGPPGGWRTADAARAVAVGLFDGVHRGHAAVIGRAGEEAAERGLEHVVLTFDPHPLSVVRPNEAPPLLATLDQRLEQFAALGVARAAVLPFNDQIRHMTPFQFALAVLDGALGAGYVVVGADFRFGFGREGDAAGLVGIGRELGFEAEAVPLVGGDRPISSSRIRRLLGDGDVSGAAQLLGRPYELRGAVVAGEGRGAGIGVPTANLEAPSGLVVPGRGVYAVEVSAAGLDYGGAANVGVRPTFGGDNEVVEAHLFDFTGDLYGEVLAVRFIERLREERKFPSVDDLVRQIRRDIDAAAEVLSAR